MKVKVACLVLCLESSVVWAMNQEFVEAPLVRPEFVSYLQTRANLAYGPVRDLREVDGLTPFFTDAVEHTDETLAGFVEKRRQYVIVAFPGTYRWSDVWKDVSIFSSDGGYSRSVWENESIKVHPAFAKDVQSFFGTMNNLIGEVDGQEIFFTGHSKGGGTATIAALKYAKTKVGILKQSQLKVFAFSSPPVLDINAVNSYHKLIGELNHVNIYNNWDVIPYLPLQLKFYHAGIQANVNAKGHGIATFTRERVQPLMRRIEKNYRINPFMSRYEMGRP